MLTQTRSANLKHRRGKRLKSTFIIINPPYEQTTKNMKTKDIKTVEEKLALIESIYIAYDNEVIETHEQVIDMVRDVIENREVNLPELEK